MYDNFIFANDATVTDVHWVGLIFADSGPTANTPSAFTITFWSDNGGQLGSALGTPQLFPAGNFSVTPIVSPNYAYSVDLTTDFLASAGTTYWMSIVADVAVDPEDDNVWTWASAYKGGDNKFYQGPAGGSLSQLDGRLTFDLTGLTVASVPEPSSLVLLSAGLAGLGLARRKLRT